MVFRIFFYFFLSLLLRKKLITPKWSLSSKAYIVIRTSHYKSFSLRRRQPVVIFLIIMKEISHLCRTDAHSVQTRSQTLRQLTQTARLEPGLDGTHCPLRGFFRGSINSANKIGAPCNINFQRGSAHSVNYSTKKKGPSKVRTRTQCLQCKIAKQERKQKLFFFFQSSNLVGVFFGLAPSPLPSVCSVVPPLPQQRRALLTFSVWNSNEKFSELTPGTELIKTYWAAANTFSNWGHEYA